MKKAISLTLSTAVMLSSLAALQLTGSAADDSISLGSEREFDAVRITYTDGAAPTGAKLTVNDKDYDLVAGKTSQVVNVDENTNASSILLSNYNAATTEIKLLDYTAIEMTTNAEAGTTPYTKPYLEDSWSGGDHNTSGTNMSGVSAARHAGSFDGDYKDGLLTDANSRSVYYKPEYTPDGESAKKRDTNSWFALNFNFLEETEIAKVSVLEQGAAAYISGYTVGIISESTAKSPDTVLGSVSLEDAAAIGNIDITSDYSDSIKAVDTILNTKTQRLQLKFDDFSDKDLINVYELVFYTYKDVYTVGQETYTINLPDAPEAFNAVRLTYPTEQNFIGNSQFLDSDDNPVGSENAVSFNNSTTGAAVLDLADIAATTASKLKITVPTGVGEPTVGAYLKYKLIDMTTYAESGTKPYTKPYLANSWNGGDHNTDGTNMSDITASRYTALFDGTYDDGILINANNRNGYYKPEYTPEGESTKVRDTNSWYALNFDFLKETEIAKVSVLEQGLQTFISGYTVGIISDSSAKAPDTKLSSVSLADVSDMTAVEIANNNNEKVKKVDAVVNTNAQYIQVKLDDFSASEAVYIYELMFYTFEEIEDESDPTPTPISPVEVDANSKLVNTAAGAAAIAYDATVTGVEGKLKKATWTIENYTKDVDLSGDKRTEFTNANIIFGLVITNVPTDQEEVPSATLTVEFE